MLAESSSLRTVTHLKSLTPQRIKHIVECQNPKVLASRLQNIIAGGACLQLRQRICNYGVGEDSFQLCLSQLFQHDSDGLFVEGFCCILTTRLGCSLTSFDVTSGPSLG